MTFVAFMSFMSPLSGTCGDGITTSIVSPSLSRLAPIPSNRPRCGGVEHGARGLTPVPYDDDENGLQKGFVAAG